MSYNDYFGKNVTNISTEVSNTFVRKVMLNMIGGLLVTTLVPIYVFFINQGLMYTLAKYLNIVALGEIVLVFVLTLGLKKMSSGTARLLFYIYALMNGILLSSLTFIFQPVSILYTLAVTIIMFVVIGIYGYTTKEDLTKYGNFLTTGLITIIIISLINFFVKAPMLYWIGTILGVVIFSALIAFDINRIKDIASDMVGNDEETMKKLGIIGALNLYLDFINLFLYLLRIFGKKRD